MTFLESSRVGGDAGWPALLRIVVGAVVGTNVYVGVLAALRAPELTALRQRLPSRRAATVL